MRVLVLALTAIALAGCGTEGLSEENADISQGKLLFKQKCGACHTLREADTQGSTANPATGGPNLDDAFAAPREEGFDESTIRETIRHQIDFAAEPMPRDLVEGVDAEAVAAYVAQVAADPEAEVALPSGSGGDDPKLVFESNCATCHALADAGASGEIGPNLDQVQPSVARSVRQIANGGGGMPEFKDQLSQEQIQALAEYIARVAGK